MTLRSNTHLRSNRQYSQTEGSSRIRTARVRLVPITGSLYAPMQDITTYAAFTAEEPTLTDSAPQSLWRNTNFLILLSGQTISTLGNQISTLALPLLVLALTGSPTQAGLIAALEALPFLIFSLPAGALAD